MKIILRLSENFKQKVSPYSVRYGNFTFYFENNELVSVRVDGWQSVYNDEGYDDVDVDMLLPTDLFELEYME